MAKKAKPIKVTMKLEIEAGKATPAPPIGPALGQHGVNIGEFVTKYNDMTREMMGDVIPCILTVYEDRSFDITLKTPPVASLIKKAAGIPKGSATPNTNKKGKITPKQVREIAERKLNDLNTNNIESAIKIVMGTAKSLGVEISS
ncbi:MAG: 50S ribosomal protein L11 [Candidatus Dojkabacteria bacterium]|uniref:Large ribosomal subunit protein uL11 n=2 Tax=Candidatus Dojkabacteria TaxID=74243 RepID=A0A136KEL1_9BACT|nr:MAG: 50S ribosomal protein L11 [candidate division WS6 bacterium OLB21]MBW7953271.1 50S ribosomal protein L11 [Candidatus Dojkabacteria bacterium]WKZ28413.1 MAG: 50S ribosomal protein L11 [Candidatus Dojkabacteria bacterium]